MDEDTETDVSKKGRPKGSKNKPKRGRPKKAASKPVKAPKEEKLNLSKEELEDIAVSRLLDDTKLTETGYNISTEQIINPNPLDNSKIHRVD